MKLFAHPAKHGWHETIIELDSDEIERLSRGGHVLRVWIQPQDDQYLVAGDVRESNRSDE